MVGDRWRDIEAGRNARVRATIHLDSGHTEPLTIDPDFRAKSMKEAVDWILEARPS
jgi:phosphoglycolate phosphatase-like HAD superfamily hydrolase